MIQYSIIIPFHKNANMLYVSLKTLYESINIKDNVEIIIVANNSDEKEIELTIFDEKIRLIQIGENLFYPRAINLGVQYSSGNFLFFCDPDIFYIEGWFEAILKVFSVEKKIGCVGAKLINPLNNRIIDFGIGYHDYHRCHVLRGMPYKHDLAQHNLYVNSFCSAILCVKKDLFVKIGGMSEEMPYAFCDNDFTLKAIELGYNNVVVHDALAYHKSYTDLNNSKYYAFSYLREDCVAAFFSRHNDIPNDYQRYLEMSWNWNINKYKINIDYIFINLSTAYNWKTYLEIIKDIGINILDIDSFLVNERNSLSIPLFNYLPNRTIDIHTPFLYFVDNYTSLFENSLWFSLRNIENDLVIDRDANVIPMQLIAKYLI